MVLLLAQIIALADLLRVSLDLFSIHFIITLHSSIAATSASQYKKKTKIEQNAINSCHVLHCHVLHIHALQVGPSFSCQSFQRPR